MNLHLVIEGEEEIGSGNLGPFLSKSRRTEVRCSSCFRYRDGCARHADAQLWAARSYRPRVKVTVRKWICTRAFSAARLRIHHRIGAIAGDASRSRRSRGNCGILRSCQAARRLGARSVAQTSGRWRQTIREETGVPELFGEAGYNSVERIWARPTAEINGIGGGYQGQGTKTVIPSHAIAKLTFRLVPDQKGEEILKLASAFGKKSAERCYDGNHHGPQWPVVSYRSALRDGRSGTTRVAQSFQGTPR